MDLNNDIENEINTIKLTSNSDIASVLSCSENQAGKFKRGFSGLSNEQAQLLKIELGLEPRAFVEIVRRYKENQSKKEVKKHER